MADAEPFDLHVLEQVADPYPVLAELRSGGTVRRTTDGFWAVTGHAEALDALRLPGCASSPVALRFLEGLPPGAARDEMVHRINFLDPPDHPRVRGLLSTAFTPRRVAALRPWMESTAAGLAAGLHGQERFDLLSAFSHQLPSLVISELLGVPAADRDRLTDFSDRTAPLLGLRSTVAQRAAAVDAAEEFHAYLGELLDERASAPGDDLLSALLAATAEDAGGTTRLSRPELLSLAATLYSAGHRTTRDLFTNGVSVLLDDPDRWQRVVAGEWSVADVVAEFLRYETPTLYVVRVPLEPLEIGGVQIGPWEPLVVVLGAANRDPAVYRDPDAFQPGRSGPPALSFAFGAHYCLGASLARSEAEVMLSTVVNEFPELRDADGVPALRPWHQRGAFRGLNELLVAP
ncbi:MAG: cytochrome P450 [Actinomycetes bacterium]